MMEGTTLFVSASSEVIMFKSHCTACDTTYLVFSGMITRLASGDEGIVVTYTCWCGAEQEWHSRHPQPVAA